MHLPVTFGMAARKHTLKPLDLTAPTVLTNIYSDEHWRRAGRRRCDIHQHNAVVHVLS
jgi:hypothetical protein